MGTEGEALAAGLAAARAEVEEFVRGCDERAWRATGTAEGWPVGVVAMHCAEGNQVLLGWLRGMLGGEGVSLSAADVDARNHENAQRWAGTTPGEVLAELAGADAVIACLTALSEADLDRIAPFGPAGGAELPVRTLAAAAERHLRRHLESMRDGVAGGPTPGA